MIDLGVKKDFPIFETHPALVYLDNAATVHKPTVVIEAEAEFYRTSYANIHRGTYDLAYGATEAYEGVRKKVAAFIGAVAAEEIIFTLNATMALNLAAHIESQRLRAGEEIIVQVAGHHSNILPWQRAARETGAKIVWWEPGESLAGKVSEKTRVIAVAQVTNVMGEVLELPHPGPCLPDRLALLTKERGKIRIVLDCAQSASRMPMDIRALGVDYAAFSGHKLYGPTGTGWLYAKWEHLETAEPLLVGGGTVKKVERGGVEWAEIPRRFEAGTYNVAGFAALGAAIDYLKSIGMERIKDHDRELTKYAIEQLSKIEGLEMFSEGVVGVISLRLGNIHSHDLAEVANSQEVAIRAGQHCAQLLMAVLGVNDVTRVSLGIYNVKEDIDRLVEVLKTTKAKFA
jgi:cysteine desulfurase/selenocysteine lyase